LHQSFVGAANMGARDSGMVYLPGEQAESNEGSRQTVNQRMFRIIGQYSIDRDEDIIRVWSSPEFNLEAARQYALDMIAIIREMPPRFAVMVCFDAPPVVAPEVEESMRLSARERAACGMVAAAFVTASADAIEVARAQWTRIYEGSGVACRFFDEPGTARDWLQAKVDASPLRR
jgi:hypothetical protein